MKAMFGLVSLMAVLVIVGLLVSKQLKATGQGLGAHAGASAPGASQVQPGNVGEQSRQLQEKVRADAVKALEQGARRSDPEQ
ncbi:MAG: hypothetical protein RLZZ618_2498 [Pseudomonadota bacterium]|jgi:hypothetical protein